MWYGSPQFAYDTYGPRSTIRISAFSSSLRRRAAHDAPPATPPTMMTFMMRLLPVLWFVAQLSMVVRPGLRNRSTSSMPSLAETRSKRMSGRPADSSMAASTHR